LFLSHLRAEVTAREQAVGADDRQRQVMADARYRPAGRRPLVERLVRRVSRLRTSRLIFDSIQSDLPIT
jgi:hypothetical protein